MLKLNILCTRFKINIIVVQLRAMKLYAAIVEAFKKKERQDET
jgi:hypothetical protein